MAPTALHPATTLPTALLLVDIQAGLTPSPTSYFGTSRSTPNFEENITSLLSHTRAYNTAQPPSSSSRVSIVHVKHNSTSPSSPLHPSKDTNAFMPCAKPVEGEMVFSKNTNSAFINTPLEQTLREKGIKQLLICGITTAHCVSTTTRMAKDLRVVGDEGVVALVEDASAAFNSTSNAGGMKREFDAETVHAVNVASLEGEFARVVRMGDVLRDVLGGRE
jgi:nicotinamidase-related amidase